VRADIGTVAAPDLHIAEQVMDLPGAAARLDDPG